ncbi:MAG: hypothetical protein HXX20_04960 [Chloroflexi bacterium]|nr:hypothetical protein [Chloroflexota bacterium]
MSVEIENSLKFNPTLLNELPVESAQAEEGIPHNFCQCLNCRAEVILLARTIQTFCYLCGEPVTKPDKHNMYYE